MHFYGRAVSPSAIEYEGERVTLQAKRGCQNLTSSFWTNDWGIGCELPGNVGPSWNAKDEATLLVKGWHVTRLWTEMW